MRERDILKLVLCSRWDFDGKGMLRDVLLKQCLIRNSNYCEIYSSSRVGRNYSQSFIFATLCECCDKKRFCDRFFYDDDMVDWRSDNTSVTVADCASVGSACNDALKSICN